MPVDPAARAGISLTGTYDSEASRRMWRIGKELLARLEETVLGLRLDDRGLPMDRAHDEEEDLARLLIAATWYQVNYRTSIGFAYTPLAVTAREDPAAFPLERLLQLPHRDLAALRAAFTELLDGCTADDVPYKPEEQDRVRLLLQRLAPVADPGHCTLCTQRCPDSAGRPREFCSLWCRSRAHVLRAKGLLPGGPAPLLPRRAFTTGI